MSPTPEGQSNSDSETVSFKVNVLPLPDLTVSSISAPASANVGDIVEVSFTVENKGGPVTESFTNRIFLSTKRYGGGQDILLGEFPMTLNGTKSRSETVHVTIPQVEAGQWYVAVFTDANMAVNESDENNNISSAPVTIIGATPTDRTPPTAPTNLRAVAVSPTQIDLSWNPSTDNVGVAGYKIFRNGSFVRSVQQTSFNDTGLTPATRYCYKVSAYDAAGNESNPSSEACATTTAPSPSFDFEISVDPLSKTVEQGRIVSTTVRAWNTAGPTTRVDFTVSGFPAEVTVDPQSWSWNLGDQNHAVVFSVGSNTPAGTYTIKIRGTGGGVTKEKTFTLTVTAPTSSFDFDISVNPSSWTARQNDMTSITVRGWRTAGLTTLVSFSITGLPSGITVNPSSWNWNLGDQSRTVTFSVSTNAPVGSHTITIVGSGGGKTKTATFSITVTGKFKVGDPVYVYGTGGVGLRVRDAPCGKQIANKPDGARGIVVEGPVECALDGKMYRWWKIRLADGVVGWSVEDYLGLAIG